MQYRYCFVVLLLFTFAGGTAGASLVTSTGAVEVITPPDSVSNAVLTDPNTGFVFQERSSELLTQALNVQISLPGTSPIESGKNFSPTTLPAGLQVDSYFVHFNLPSDHVGIAVLAGSLTFDQEILGVAVYSDPLRASDLVLGAPGTEYPSPPAGFRGFEFGFGDGAAAGTIDSVTISQDRRTIEFISRSNGLDQLRVVTAVPEPSSLVLSIGAGISMLALRLRRRGSGRSLLHQPTSDDFRDLRRP